MNKVSVKMSSLAMCAALCVSGAGTVFASEGETNAAAAAAENERLEKDETVYILAGADGTVNQIIVSDWIKNISGEDSISDLTKLSGLETVKGDEAYTVSGEETVWDAQGNDIYYQGTSDAELPVGLTVSYQLDGESVSAGEIAGKSGQVTIRFDYENRQYETVELNGKEEKIYVPFAALTGMILDSEQFRNVEVSNGKLLNDGDRTTVIGIAFPGLKDSVGIGEDQFEIPDSVEITADVSEFSFGMTVTVVTNELFNHFDTSKLASVSDLTDSLGELKDGISQLCDGAKALSDGTVSLESGAEQLKTGAADLSAGLQTLTDNNEVLNGGAKQVFETLLSTAEAQLTEAGLDVPPLTIGNYAEVLAGVTASLDETTVYGQALEQVTAAVEQNRAMITEKVSEAVREQVAEQVIAEGAGMAKADYEAAVLAGMVPEETQAAVSAAIELQMQTEAVQHTVSENTEAQVQQAISENMESEEVKARLNAAVEGAASIAALKTSLDSYNEFYSGLLSYTGGVSSAAEGAAALAAGASDLYGGTTELKDGASALSDGTVQLKDGTATLDESEYTALLERVKAAAEISKRYHNYSGISEEMDGQVKFIYRTDEIRSE